MNPREFEEAVAQQLRREGYQTELGSYAGDFGVDIIASRGAERLAVQAKMYGHTSRPVNRQMVMELYGAAAYFDCTGSVIATDGRVLADAIEVADKLGVRLLYMRGEGVESELRPSRPSGAGAGSEGLDFEGIWERFVIPLQGLTLVRGDGGTNIIERVDWSGVQRISSSGRRSRIKIEIFRFAIGRILTTGSVTRSEINDNYVGRASSGVVLILAQVPLFELLTNPLRLALRRA